METIPSWLGHAMVADFVFLAVALSLAKLKDWRTGESSLLGTIYDLVTFG